VKREEKEKGRGGKEELGISLRENDENTSKCDTWKEKLLAPTTD